MTKSTLKPGRQRDWEQQLFPNSPYMPDAIWRNILNPDSLRLTTGAHKHLKATKKYQFYSFQVDSMSNLQLLQLDRLFKSPYFIKSRQTIELMGEEDAIMLQLHANNLKQYLDNLSNV